MDVINRGPRRLHLWLEGIGSTGANLGRAGERAPPAWSCVGNNEMEKRKRWWCRCRGEEEIVPSSGFLPKQLVAYSDYGMYRIAAEDM